MKNQTSARTIKRNRPQIKIILTTSTAEAKWIEKAQKAGIDSFWFKEYSDIPLTEVMDRTMNGESVYPGIPPNPDFGEVTKCDLTERELEIAGLAAQRKSSREIAETLNISVKSVNNRLNAVYEKMGLGGEGRNKRQALAKLIKNS